MPAATAVHHTVLNQEPLGLLSPFPYSNQWWNISVACWMYFSNGFPSIGVMRIVNEAEGEIIKRGSIWDVIISVYRKHTAWSHTFTCFIKLTSFSLCTIIPFKVQAFFSASLHSIWSCFSLRIIQRVRFSIPIIKAFLKSVSPLKSLGLNLHFSQ